MTIHILRKGTHTMRTTINTDTLTTQTNCVGQAPLEKASNQPITGFTQNSPADEKLPIGTLHSGGLYWNLKRPSDKSKADDAAAIGLINGLPYLVIVDGAFRSSGEGAKAFAETYIPNLIPRIIDDLINNSKEKDSKSDDGDTKDIFQKHLIELNTLVEQFNQSQQGDSAKFNFAVAFAYQNSNNETIVAGFGIGDTYLAMQNEDGTYTTLKPASNYRYIDHLDQTTEMAEEVKQARVPFPYGLQRMLPFDIHQAETIEDMIYFSHSLPTNEQNHLRLVGSTDGGLCDNFAIKQDYVIRQNKKTIKGKMTTEIHMSFHTTPQLAKTPLSQLTSICEENQKQEMKTAEKNKERYETEIQTTDILFTTKIEPQIKEILTRLSAHAKHQELVKHLQDLENEHKDLSQKENKDKEKLNTKARIINDTKKAIAYQQTLKSPEEQSSIGNRLEALEKDIYKLDQILGTSFTEDLKKIQQGNLSNTEKIDLLIKLRYSMDTKHYKHLTNLNAYTYGGDDATIAIIDYDLNRKDEFIAKQFKEFSQYMGKYFASADKIVDDFADFDTPKDESKDNLTDSNTPKENSTTEKESKDDKISLSSYEIRDLIKLIEHIKNSVRSLHIFEYSIFKEKTINEQELTHLTNQLLTVRAYAKEFQYDTKTFITHIQKFLIRIQLVSINNIRLKKGDATAIKAALETVFNLFKALPKTNANLLSLIKTTYAEALAYTKEQHPDTELPRGKISLFSSKKLIAPEVSDLEKEFNRFMKEISTASSDKDAKDNTPAASFNA